MSPLRGFFYCARFPEARASGYIISPRWGWGGVRMGGASRRTLRTHVAPSGLFLLCPISRGLRLGLHHFAPLGLGRREDGRCVETHPTYSCRPFGAFFIVPDFPRLAPRATSFRPVGAGAA